MTNWFYQDLPAAIDTVSEPRPVPLTLVQLKNILARRSLAAGKHYTRLFESGGLLLQASDACEGGRLIGTLRPAQW